VEAEALIIVIADMVGLSSVTADADVKANLEVADNSLVVTTIASAIGAKVTEEVLLSVQSLFEDWPGVCIE